MDKLPKRRRFVLNGRNEYSRGPERFCFDFDVKYNRHGHIEVNLPEKICRSFVPFFRSEKYVFNKAGVCISHPPSKNYKQHKVNAELVDTHTS